MFTDPSLALPATPYPLAPLPGPGDTLAYAGAARPRPFLLATGGCSLRGTETRGVDAAEHAGRLLLAGLAVRGAACGNVLLAPAQARRELLTASGSVVETLLVSAHGVLAEWLGSGPGRGTSELVLVLPGISARAEGAFLRVDGADGVRLLQLTPAPEWRLEARGREGVLRAVAALSGPGAARLALTSGQDLARAEDALRHLTLMHPARAHAHLTELRARRLATRTGVPELDDGLAWAVARLEAALPPGGDRVHDLAAGEPFPLDPEARRGWTALGAVAAGAPVHSLPDVGSPLGVLARARLALRAGHRVRTADFSALVARTDPRPADAARRTALRAALLEGADALEPWEGRAAADELRARAGTLTAAPAPLTGGAVRLPTVGAPPRLEDAAAAALAAALELPGRGPYRAPDADPPRGVLRALSAWACLNEGQVERGFALYRTHLAEGLAHGAGLWPEGARVHDPAAAALVPLVLVHGLLGARADGHYGRLRLAPRLPGHWTRFEVGGLVVGDAMVRMVYAREAGRHRFRFVQESGAVPVMLVFEPLLSLAPTAPVRVDGEPAALDLRPGPPEVGGRVRAAVQLPLDRTRELLFG